MQREFVLVTCDVDCKWTGEFPRYRVYVNDEMFTERSWIWHNDYLKENIQINAPAGAYKIKLQLLDTAHAELIVSNMRVKTGPATISPEGDLVITTTG